MRGRFSTLVLLLASFAGCGASCKKPPEAVAPDEAAGAIAELPGVDTSSLIISEKRTFSKIVHEYSSPCGDPITLDVCVKESRPCKKCLPAARAVARMIPKGEGEREIREWLDNRFDDKGVKSVDIGSSPSIGPSSASLIVVEFADFECPHCGYAAPLLHKLFDEKDFKPITRFAFKNYPLPGHEHAEPAARAALAAGEQGKFWEMHDVLFAHQDALGSGDIESYARKMGGLDYEKWRTAMASATIKDRVAKDREAGTKVGITGTPSIFVNGRKFVQIGHGDFIEQLRDWLRLEVALIGSAGAPSAPGPAPSPSIGNVPSASASASAHASTAGGTR